MDDIIITGSNPSYVSKLVQQFGKEFVMKDLGPLHFFLRVEVKYFDGVTHLAPKHGLHEVVGILVEASFLQNDSRELSILDSHKIDITRAVNLASQFMQNLNSGHLQGVKMILIYIKSTLHFGLRLISQSPCRSYRYSSYADWEGCTKTRRSATGYSIYLGANCISWPSKKQSTVARSSVEAEYRALDSTSLEMTWIMYLLHDLGFVRDNVARGKLVTQFVRSKDQLADIHTKALTQNHQTRNH
uniref:Reverse transcriptase Ty1/copia-type domain-containing protein n=1 Tax=Solanum lycopersicum TaxID=4081 RepID=A0A3Q7IYK2_SOLLC